MSLGRDLDDDVALGIAHVEQLAPFDRRVLGLAVGDDELRRLLGDEDAGRGRRRGALLFIFGELLLRLQGRDPVRYRGGRRPRALDLARLVPGVLAAVEVVHLGARIQHDPERRVHHPHELRVLDLLQARLAFDRHEHGGCR